MTNFAYGHFCEDIRHEVGNKTSLMGLLGPVVAVEEFPVVLPKLCAIGFCCSPIDEPFRTLTMRVIADGNVIYEFAADEAMVASSYSATQTPRFEDPNDSVTMRSLGTSTVFSPFIAEKEMSVRIVFIADGREYPAARIYFKKAEDLDQS